jgi:hypothetical protein
MLQFSKQSRPTTLLYAADPQTENDYDKDVLNSGAELIHAVCEAVSGTTTIIEAKT